MQPTTCETGVAAHLVLLALIRGDDNGVGVVREADMFHAVFPAVYHLVHDALLARVKAESLIVACGGKELTVVAEVHRIHLRGVLAQHSPHAHFRYHPARQVRDKPKRASRGAAREDGKR